MIRANLIICFVMSSLSTNIGWSEESSNGLIVRVEPYVSGDDPAHRLSTISAIDECLGQSIRQSIEITLGNNDYQTPACNTPFEETSDNESIGIKIIGHKGVSSYATFDWIENHPNGQLAIKGLLRYGTRDGLWERYHENGKLFFKGLYVQGERQDQWAYYYDSGKLKWKGFYKLGKEEGLFQEYYDNGKLSIKEYYTDGKRDGVFEKYYKNGQLEKKVSYKRGNETGLCEEYHENGKRLLTGVYQNGRRDGLWEYFKDDGSLAKTITWEYGVVVKD